MGYILKCKEVMHVESDEIVFANYERAKNPLGLDVSAETMNKIIKEFSAAYDAVEDEDEILTMKEASKYLNLSLNTLRKLDMESKLVPMRTDGGRRRYRKRELNEYLESRKHAKGTRKKQK